MKNTKTSLILISVSMTILAFTGCGSMPNSMKTPMNNTNRTNQISKSISTATMKTLYSNTLKELVTDNTITNTQSKKVLAAITKNMSQGSVTNSSGGTTTNTGTPGRTGTPGTTGTTGTNSTTGTPGTTGTGTTNSNQTGTTNNTNVINGLSSLVKSKVITQVQSDTIYQKIHTELENIQSNK